ncbi:hypothetical protein ABPG75_013555 [Micractinium tetrahymenae]
MAPRRSSYEFQEDEDGHEALQRAGKALLGAKVGKDQLLRTLRSAAEHLAEAAQSSDSAKLASRDLAKALGSPQLLQHKDKEVRLYSALCLCHILRLNAPDTPYSDEQLQSIFELFNSVYSELEDPASPHFQLCLSTLETVSQVKCSLLILDLPTWEELTVSLFTTLMDVVNEENVEMLQGTVLELLRSMVEEADDLPQAQLDVLLTRLLPPHRAESPAGHALAAALLQRTETTVQPHLQKFLTALLTGARTDSELKGDYHSLFYAIHETVPQALLPLLPLLRDELEADGEGAKRAPTVDLVARLFTQHTSGAGIIKEYPALLEGLLGRACDKEAEVRRKVLEYAGPLVDACEGSEARQAAIVRAAVGRLYDVDDGVRKAAVAAVGALLQRRPGLASSQHTEGRGPVLGCLVARLRDKKMAVRREAAAQLGSLLRGWVLLAAESPAHAPPRSVILSIPLVLCNIAVRDTELGAHIFDTVFRAGVFPPKLPPAETARWWAAMWRQAGEEHRPMLVRILQGKAAMQRQVQLLVALRGAAKDKRASSLAGAGSSMGAGAAGAPAPSGSLLTAGGGAAGQGADPEARLQGLVHDLAAVLKDVSRPEEGLQKLLEQKDNHIFKGLSTLATLGCPFKDAVAAGKDVMQRVGSKGPAADLTRALVARLTPNLLPPEVLQAAMEAAAQSEEVQHFLVDVAGASPQLLAQSMAPLEEMSDADGPLLAECAAKVLARAARPMLAHCAATKQPVPAALSGKLTGMCTEGSPTGVKAAVKALVAVLGPERAASVAAELADKLVAQLKAPATLRSHARLLAALKGLSMLGRLLPAAFERVADEVLDFVVADLMEADVSRGKPLVPVDPAKTGRKWRHPSPSTALKSAALRTLCQALVPDSSRAQPSQAMIERAQIVWELLEQLLDTDAEAEQFQPFAFVFPRSGDAEEQRGAKRRRVEGGGSGSDEEAEEDEELECTDAAWVRYSAVCGLLRLARTYDSAMPASLYANLALTFQEPLVETRRSMTAKLTRAVGWLTTKGQSAQRSAKYAAVLALMAIDPEDRNRAAALRALRDYVLTRRAAVARLSQAQAAAGGGGGNLLGDMPEFMLPFLIFLLAHHPDYPTEEALEEFAQADAEEREELYGQGGTPFTPFAGMLQFALEALVVPSDNPTTPSEVARHLPALLKMLRSLKFCEDASGEPRTQEAHQLCDIAMVLLRQIALRLTKGKPAEPGRFPGQVVLPRMCFRPNMQGQGKKSDGSDLPESRFFSPALLQDDLFFRRLQLMPGLPAPAKGGGRQRGRPAAQQAKRGKGRKAAAAAAEEGEDTEMAEASEGESVGGTPAPGDAADAHGGQPGSSARQRKPAAGKRGRAAAAAEDEGGDSGAESAGGATAGGEQEEQEEQQRLAPRTKKLGSNGSGKRAAAPRSRPAGTPSRQQPRRGTKAEAAAKLRDESSEEEEEGEEEVAPAGSSQETEAEDEAPRRQRLHQSEQVQQQRGGRATAPAAAGPHGRNLRADTEDEEWEDDEAAQQEPAQPPPRAAAKTARQPAKQQPKQPRKQPQGVDSPGQENRAASNAAATAKRGGGSKPVAAGKAKAAAAPAAKGKAAVKPLLKRARA